MGNPCRSCRAEKGKCHRAAPDVGAEGGRPAAVGARAEVTRLPRARPCARAAAEPAWRCKTDPARVLFAVPLLAAAGHARGSRPGGGR